MKKLCLVKNSGEGDWRDHLTALRHVVKKASKISIAVAFLKKSGLNLFFGELQECLYAGAEIEIFVGRDFWQTEPAALEKLHNLSKDYSSLKVYLMNKIEGSTFHPKMYLGCTKLGARLLVGSANLTAGGLAINEEVSLLCALRSSDPVLEELCDTFTSYKSKKLSARINEKIIDKYRIEFEEEKKWQHRSERESDTDKVLGIDLEMLTIYYNKFCKNGKNEESFGSRRTDRKRARKVQRRISELGARGRFSKKEEGEFQTLYKDLVTSKDGHPHLWPATGIDRTNHIEKVFNQIPEAIELFALANKASKKPVKIGFSMMRQNALEIKGIGINAVSEMLCTMAPTKFAVYNGCSTSALDKLGVNFARKTLNPSRIVDDYEKFCRVVSAVGKHTNMENLSDVDAFLYWFDKKSI